MNTPVSVSYVINRGTEAVRENFFELPGRSLVGTSIFRVQIQRGTIIFANTFHLTMTTQQTSEILLVEDSPVDVLLVHEAFAAAMLDIRVNVVSDGVEALEYLHRRGDYGEAMRPGLILLDWNMPRMNGYELLASLKGIEEFKSIPVVVLTTSRDIGEMTSAYERGANCFITKPVDFESFVTMVKGIQRYWFEAVNLATSSERKFSS